MKRLEEENQKLPCLRTSSEQMVRVRTRKVCGVRIVAGPVSDEQFSTDEESAQETEEDEDECDSAEQDEYWRCTKFAENEYYCECSECESDCAEQEQKEGKADDGDFYINVEDDEKEEQEEQGEEEEDQDEDKEVTAGNDQERNAKVDLIQLLRELYHVQPNGTALLCNAYVQWIGVRLLQQLQPMHACGKYHLGVQCDNVVVGGEDGVTLGPPRDQNGATERFASLQLLNGEPSPKCDVWSFGVLLADLCTCGNLTVVPPVPQLSELMCHLDDTDRDEVKRLLETLGTKCVARVLALREACISAVTDLSLGRDNYPLTFCLDRCLKVSEQSRADTCELQAAFGTCVPRFCDVTVCWSMPVQRRVRLQSLAQGLLRLNTLDPQFCCK
eukprot:TRINITY_DN5347_c0_g1_i4.p1 TRINITY_DN5347_c0_g1~~TRINITY_DN5347_c0_g1_i4.p1  ORF type:complete len:387 (-),score=81.95 TRINITY_DN5347_c0_g1_i4:42-1202(-)